MTTLADSIDIILSKQEESQKPLAIILAGHNGSGKSTMWYEHLADSIQIPLINADRMMLSILPEKDEHNELPAWAAELRDSNNSWMKVAQKGVEAFVAQAMSQNVPFAMETVFSHWKQLENGDIESKIQLIKELQDQDYFVVLVFVGLSNSQLSIARVMTRHAQGGHDVPEVKLLERFPRTQVAIRAATKVADAVILTDNSLDMDNAFSVARVEINGSPVYDCRDKGGVPPAIIEWLDNVSPVVN